MGKGYINNKIGITLLFAATLLAASPVQAEDIAGKVKVIEGDIIEIDGRRIRLYGMDAPEADQLCADRKGKEYPCGDHAKRHLAAMVGRFPLKCEQKAGDEKAGDEKVELVAVCYLGFVNVNENMVFDGWALAFEADGNDYVRAEKAARARHQGLWKGHVFVTPWDWRQGKR